MAPGRRNSNDQLRMATAWRAGPAHPYCWTFRRCSCAARSFANGSRALRTSCAKLLRTPLPANSCVMRFCCSSPLPFDRARRCCSLQHCGIFCLQPPFRATRLPWNGCRRRTACFLHRRGHPQRLSSCHRLCAVSRCGFCFRCGRRRVRRWSCATCVCVRPAGSCRWLLPFRPRLLLRPDHSHPCPDLFPLHYFAPWLLPPEVAPRSGKLLQLCLRSTQ